MKTDLVIFDCDGVLVDSEPVTDRVMAANLTRHGWPVSPEEVGALFLGGTIQSAGDEARRRGARLPDDWTDEAYAEIFAALRQGVDVMPGVFELIDRLEAAGIALAVASNGPLAKMEITLTPSGLWQRFAGRIYSGHDHGPKPRPDMIWRILADADVPRAAAVLIDDSAPGCLSARNAGIRCLGYAPHGDGAALRAVGATPIRSLDAVAGLLGL